MMPVVDVHYVFTIILHVSATLGLLNEWINLLYVELWSLYFLTHLLLFSVYAIYVDLVLKRDVLREHLLYHVAILCLWFYQHVYALNSENVQNFEVGCKRDLLVVTTTTSFTILLMACGGAFSVLVT